MQACVAGCSPLAPARVAYPEWLQAQFLYPVDEDPRREARAVVERLQLLAESKASGEALPLADLSRYSREQLLVEYRRVLSSAAQLST